MRILQGFLMIMGVLAVLAVVALVFGYVLALLTPDIRNNLRPVVLSSESVDSFNKKMQDMRSQMRGQGTADITITLTEEEVNSMIVMAMAEGHIPAKEILVNFNDGYLVLYSAWNFAWFPVKTGLIGSFDIEDKKPKFIVQNFFLGKLPLPSSINANVQELANILIRINPMIYNSRYNYKEITITEGKIKLSGSVERFSGPPGAGSNGSSPSASK